MGFASTSNEIRGDEYVFQKIPAGCREDGCSSPWPALSRVQTNAFRHPKNVLVTFTREWATPLMESPTSLSPTTLISRARLGSDAAFGSLFRVYQSYLHLLAEIQISERMQAKLDASDVVQEAFLRIQAGFGGFRGESEEELVVWLRQILARTLVDLVRRFEGTAKRSVALERTFRDDLDQSSNSVQQALPSPISSPSHRAARREEAVLVADALQRLPIHYREVIVLRSFQEKSFPEVAQQMQRSVTSVKKLWPRALVRLQEELKQI